MNKFLNKFEPYNLKSLENGVRLPEIIVSNEERLKVGAKFNASNRDYLKMLCWKSLKDRLVNGKIKQSEKECVERLKIEFAVFEETGVIDYLLLLYEILTWCDEQKIIRGPGRGSACGSLALYLIDVTRVNPLDHNLNFTRFISAARAKVKYVDSIMHLDGKSMPDVDCDIGFIGRDKLIKHLEKKFAGRVCKISTSQYLTGKMALKDTLKSCYGYQEMDAKAVSDSIEAVFGKVKSLKDAYEANPQFKEWVDQNPEKFKVAQGIEGLYRTKGIHASGIILSYAPILDMMGLELSDSDEIVSAYDMETALTIYAKFDLLSLRTLDVVQHVANQIGINVYDIDIYNESIYDYFKSGTLFHGLFQIEEGLTKEAILKIKPKNIDQLAACLSISRPGAFRHIDEFANFVATGEFKKVHPLVDAILVQTGGIILYQESINDICTQVYGMSATSADEVRRAIGKKIREDMAKWEPVLYENGKKLGIDDSVTKWFWDTCNASADYLFSKNHCFAYAYITCYTVYLKANYPKQFIFALLSIAKHESDPIASISSILNEAQKLKITVLPPDITKSSEDFSFDKDGNILFGLSSVKGVSDKTMEKLTSFRREFENKFQIFETAASAKIPINVLTGLAFSGALRAPTISRAFLAYEMNVYNQLTDKEKILVHQFAKEYNEDLIAIIKALKDDKKNEKGKPLIRESRYETIKRDIEPYYQMYLSNTKNEELCCYLMEKHFLGFSYTSNLHAIYSKRIINLSTLAQISELPDKVDFTCVAFVGECKNLISKKSNKPYYSIYCNDDTLPEYKFMLFGGTSEWHPIDKIDACIRSNGSMPGEGDIVTIQGSKASGAAAFVNSIKIQENPLRLKKSEVAEAAVESIK